MPVAANIFTVNKYLYLNIRRMIKTVLLILDHTFCNTHSICKTTDTVKVNFYVRKHREKKRN